MPVLRTAYSMNIPFIHLGAGVYQLGWGVKARRIELSSVDRDSAIGARLSQNKMLTANLVRMAGLPAPHPMVAKNEQEARTVAHHLGWPLVIKPVDSDRGEGVSIGISDDKKLEEAFVRACSCSRSREMIVEEEVAGLCYRFFIINGSMLYAVKRRPKSVQGDGIHTVQELITIANQQEMKKPPLAARQTLSKG